MAQDTDALERLKLFAEMQQSEARLHWNRNQVFLVISSILLVALSQFEIKMVQLAVGFLGFVLNLSWLFIQYRSSEYIHYWKREAQKLSESTGVPNIYSAQVKGFEMRKIAYVLPGALLLFWVFIILLIVYQALCLGVV